MKPQLIEVTWIDASDIGDVPAWLTFEQVMEEVDKREVIVKSVGYDLGRRKGQLVLAGGWSPPDHPGSQEPEQFSTIQLIPSRWIKNIRSL